MAKATFLAFLFTFYGAFAQIAIVSDLDETIKRTNVSHPARALYNALFTQNIFSGMDELFREMDSYASDLFVLSASPGIFRHNIFKLLNKHDINPVLVYTRRGLENKFWYKYNVIKDVISRGYEKVILVGDDLEEDPEIYDRVKSDFPDKVLAIYIHRVTGQELPESSIPYFTAYDLALRENAAGRLPLSETWNVGELVLGEEYYGQLFPAYAFCPDKANQLLFAEVEEMRELTEKVAEKTMNYCRRGSKID